MHHKKCPIGFSSCRNSGPSVPSYLSSIGMVECSKLNTQIQNRRSQFLKSLQYWTRSLASTIVQSESSISLSWSNILFVRCSSLFLVDFQIYEGVRAAQQVIFSIIPASFLILASILQLLEILMVWETYIIFLSKWMMSWESPSMICFVNPCREEMRMPWIRACNYLGLLLSHWHKPK